MPWNVLFIWCVFAVRSCCCCCCTRTIIYLCLHMGSDAQSERKQMQMRSLPYERKHSNTHKKCVRKIITFNLKTENRKTREKGRAFSSAKIGFIIVFKRAFPSIYCAAKWKRKKKMVASVTGDAKQQLRTMITGIGNACARRHILNADYEIELMNNGTCIV